MIRWKAFSELSANMQKKTRYGAIADLIVMKKSKVGIACLSDTKENELMWTHYAGNYSGVCIEYDAERLVQALPSGVRLVRVGYNEHPHLVTGSSRRRPQKFSHTRNSIGLTNVNGGSWENRTSWSR